MGKVTLTHEEIEKAVETIRELVRDLAQMEQQMGIRNEQMSGNWEGEACSAFQKAAVSMEAACCDVIASISEESDLLNRYNRSMLAVDSNAAKQFAIEEGRASGQ